MQSFIQITIEFTVSSAVKVDRIGLKRMKNELPSQFQARNPSLDWIIALGLPMYTTKPEGLHFSILTARHFSQDTIVRPLVSGAGAQTRSAPTRPRSVSGEGSTGERLHEDYYRSGSKARCNVLQKCTVYHPRVSFRWCNSHGLTHT